MNFALADDRARVPAPDLSQLPAPWSISRSPTGWSAAESAWRQLSAPDNLVTAYQNFDFCALWLRHVGAAAGMQPFIVIGRDTTGAPLFLWPLVRTRIGPCQVATYFCGSHANFRTTLVAQRHCRQRDRSRSARHRGRAFGIRRRRAGAAQPAGKLERPSQPDADAAEPAIPGRNLWHFAGRNRRGNHRAPSEPGYAPQVSAQGTPSRRICRAFAMRRASTPEDVDRYIAEFMKQKAARLSARGIKNAFSEPGMEDFLRAACRHGLADGHPLIEIHALDSDGEVLALLSGASGRRMLLDHVQFLHAERTFATQSGIQSAAAGLSIIARSAASRLSISESAPPPTSPRSAI